MAKADKEPFGKNTKEKISAKPTGGLSPARKPNGGKLNVNLNMPKESARKEPKIDPTVNLSGGSSGRSFSGGGNVSVPVVRKPKTKVSIDVSGGGGGYKPKGGKGVGGGEVSVGATVTRTIGGSKNSSKPRR